MKRGCLSLAVVCLTLAACVSVDPYGLPPVVRHLQQDGEIGGCARLFQASDDLIETAATRDAQAPRVAGFPYLRVDRLLSALAPAATDSPVRAREWVEALMALDDTARRVELRNAGGPFAAEADRLAHCRELLSVADQANWPSLVTAARVPDDYSLTRRALGLYPLTRYAFAVGIRRWQQETVDVFTAFAEADPFVGQRRSYVIAAAPHRLPKLRAGLALGLPAVAPPALEQRIARHAPIYAIETASDDDLPGALVWRRDSDRLQVGVATDRPTVYLRTGHAWLGGRWRLQLTYAVWFAARPARGAYDLLAGRLDGLLWRATLDDDGEALVYDTIHPCGCYHLFFPTARVRSRALPPSVDEGPFLPRAMPLASVGGQIVLKLAAGSHYLQAVAVESDGGAAGVPLTVADDDDLRSLPLPEGGSRSVYGDDGLIAGSERLERWVFWPMGISSAGQMRQWGRHATAFVGRRHFDDPYLLDRYFEGIP